MKKASLSARSARKSVSRAFTIHESCKDEGIDHDENCE